MDTNRRTFLKIILIGGGTLLVGKVLGPLFLNLLNDSSAKTGSTKTKPLAFRIDDNEKRLSIYDDTGEEIFQIDKGA